MLSVEQRRSLTYKDSIVLLNHIAGRVFSNLDSCSVIYDFTETKSCSWFGFDIFNNGETVLITIGVKQLKDDIKDEMILDVDFVWTVKQILYIYRRLRQLKYVYAQDNITQDELDKLRMDILAMGLHGYRQSVRNYLSAELEIDRQSFVETTKLFDTLQENLRPEDRIDVRACLLYKSSQMPDTWPGNNKSKNLNEVMASFKSHMKDYSTCSRGKVLNEYDLAVKSKTDSWQDVLDGSERTGVSYDEQLFSMLLDIDYRYGELYPMLSGDVARIRELYPSRLSITDRILTKGSQLINNTETVNSIATKITGWFSKLKD